MTPSSTSESSLGGPELDEPELEPERDAHELIKPKPELDEPELEEAELDEPELGDGRRRRATTSDDG